jgi:hypothetical protein
MNYGASANNNSGGGGTVTGDARHPVSWWKGGVHPVQQYAVAS